MWVFSEVRYMKRSGMGETSGYNCSNYSYTRNNCSLMYHMVH